MTYFVTGATGFIGKRLVKKLLARRGSTVYFLVRKESLDKVPALLEEVRTQMKTRGNPSRGVEGEGDSAWLLMDFGDVVLHVFQPAARELYDLERLWADVPRVHWEGARAS